MALSTRDVTTPPPHFRSAVRAPDLSSKTLAGGRVTVDTTTVGLVGFPFRYTVPPDEPESEWAYRDLDAQVFKNTSPARMLELLISLSPDMSRATWDWLRYLNPGYEFDVMPAGQSVPSDDLHSVVQERIDLLADLYGSFDVVIGRLNIAAVMRGAFFSELVLDAGAREMIDLATPDPVTVRFERRQDVLRGTYWQLGQFDGFQFKAITAPTVRYIPVDPFPGNPYGRSVLSSAVFPTIFALGMLHDLRRVVAQQGYPRLDISIQLENLRKAMPMSVQQDPVKAKKWVDDVVTEVQAIYKKIQPEDAYIHTDVVQVNRPVGTVDSSSLGAIDGLMEILERMSIRSLKTIPLLMGVTDGVSEANANRQYEAYIQGVKALQHSGEAMLGYQFTLMLRALGTAASVKWRFAENRASELHRDAITDGLRINNASRKRDEGWVTQDEASEEVTGHSPTPGAERIAGPSGPSAITAKPTDGALPPDPGANR